jgi:hypothetical protein
VQCLDRFLQKRKQDLDRAVGHAVRIVLRIFSILSFLPGLVHDCLTNGGEQEKDKWKIEAWIWGWLVIEFLFLLFFVTTHPWVVIFPLARLFDLFYILLRLALLELSVWNKGRALLQLLVHYVEVVAIFASVYIYFQQMSGVPLFLVCGEPKWLSPTQGLYFSFVTAATLGGEITPRLDVILPSLVVPLEVVCILVIVVLDASHIFANPSQTRRIRPPPLPPYLIS